MIINERYTAFINSMDVEHTPFLEELYERAIRERVPVIKRETQSFLKTLLQLMQPGRILEVGAGVGFSAILMAEYSPVESIITTIENYDKRIVKARENIEKSGYGERIELLAGDGADILPVLKGTYDLIFMDAAKGQYINFLPHVKRLAAKGAVILSDNVLQDGDMIESRYIVERRDRTIYKRMREYLYAIKHDDSLSTSIIPLGDGLALSVQK